MTDEQDRVNALIKATRELVKALVEDSMWQYAALTGGVLEALDSFGAGDLEKAVPA